MSWNPSYFSVSCGNFPDSSQLKLPLSTSNPPITTPWPDKNLVAEWNIRSAPKSKGFNKCGVVNVESTNKGILFLWAISEIEGISIMSKPGFPSVSPKSSLVFAFMFFSTWVTSLKSINVVSIPNLGNVYSSKLWLPPYKDLEARIWEPWSKIVVIAKWSAAWPLEVAIAPTPPSKADILSSNTALVGFVILE